MTPRATGVSIEDIDLATEARRFDNATLFRSRHHQFATPRRFYSDTFPTLSKGGPGGVVPAPPVSKSPKGTRGRNRSLSHVFEGGVGRYRELAINRRQQRL